MLIRKMTMDITKEMFWMNLIKIEFNYVNFKVNIQLIII